MSSSIVTQYVTRHPIPHQQVVMRQLCVMFQSGWLWMVTIRRCTSGRRAVDVAPNPQEGMVVSVSESSGLIEFTQDQPYVMEHRDDKERILLQSSQVCHCISLSISAVVQDWQQCMSLIVSELWQCP